MKMREVREIAEELSYNEPAHVNLDENGVEANTFRMMWGKVMKEKAERFHVTKLLDDNIMMVMIINPFKSKHWF